MFVRHPGLPDSQKEYQDIYRKSLALMETWSEEELRCFLARFSFFKRLLLRMIYCPDAPAYQAAKDALKARRK